jgi:hypothetical protein
VRVTETYDVHRYQVSKSLPCPECGKKVRRSTTFTGTCNPFTTPPWMTYRQMREKYQPEIDAWKAKPEHCSPCRQMLAIQKAASDEKARAARHEFSASSVRVPGADGGRLWSWRCSCGQEGGGGYVTLDHARGLHATHRADAPPAVES